MTSVVNVKVAHIRPQYHNLQDWIRDTNNVYIGRMGVVFIDKVRFPKEGSIWANPFKIGKDGDRDQVLAKYKTYIMEKLENNTLIQNELDNLEGKQLGCWCYPEKCHGDVLVDIIQNRQH